MYDVVEERKWLISFFRKLLLQQWPNRLHSKCISMELYFHPNPHPQHKRQRSRQLQPYFVNLFSKANQVQLLPCILLTYQMKGYTHLSIMLHQLLIAARNLHYLWVKCPWAYSNRAAVDFISAMAARQTHQLHSSARIWRSTNYGVLLLLVWPFGRVEREQWERRTAFF